MLRYVCIVCVRVLSCAFTALRITLYTIKALRTTRLRLCVDIVMGLEAACGLGWRRGAAPRGVLWVRCVRLCESGLFRAPRRGSRRSAMWRPWAAACSGNPRSASSAALRPADGWELPGAACEGVAGGGVAGSRRDAAILGQCGCHSLCRPLGRDWAMAPRPRMNGKSPHACQVEARGPATATSSAGPCALLPKIRYCIRFEAFGRAIRAARWCRVG